MIVGKLNEGITVLITLGDVVTNFGGDWVDPDNYMVIVIQPPIEKWCHNHVIAGDMVYYDLTHEGWGDWYATGEAHDALVKNTTKNVR